jgi:amidase
MDDLAWHDATALASLIRAGQLSPLEAADAAIARIEALNPHLNAVITPLFDQARRQAAQRVDSPGPFQGVPFLLKDFICHTAGDPYYEGMRFLRDLEWREQHDTYLARKFRSAGFILVGKTNLPELAGPPVTEPAAFGPTHNPWRRGHSTGGSSGGSAAAVAAGFVPLAHANDGYGSIRIPASACGLVGLKPSRGRTSIGPARHPGLLGNITEHVLTRSVRDTAAVLDAVAGPMPGDAYVAPPPVRPFAAEVGAAPGRLRIGCLAHDPFLDMPLHPECLAAVRGAARLLESLGHHVEDSFPPGLTGPTGLGEPLGIIAASAVAARLDAWSQRTGRAITALDVEPATWARAEQGRQHSAVQVHAAAARLAAGVCRCPEWWASGFDILLTPVMLAPPPQLGLAPEQYLAVFGLFTMPWSITGQPAISLPLHATPGDLPVGIQLVAAYAREDLLIRLAAQLEHAQPWAAYRPPGSSHQHRLS